MEEIRLQKFFTDCGILSRRAAEAEIVAGRVTVNGAVAEIGQKIDPARDVVRGAPTNLFCAEEVLFEETSILPYHAPLVSFGKSEFYRFCYRDYQRPENGRIFFMLFGNQIGTGSPQWLSGDVSAEFLLR